MNEMELLAALRSEVPAAAPSVRAEALFRDGVRDIDAQPAAPRVRLPRSRPGRAPGPPGQPGWRGRLRLAGVALVAACLTAAAVVLTVPPNDGRPSPGPVGHQPSAGTTIPARLLAASAAQVALTQPTVKPGQWVYRKVEFYQTPPPRYVPNNVPAVIVESTWTTADGTRSIAGSVSQGTGTGPGPVPYAKIGSLPADPVALDAYLAHLTYPGPHATPAEKKAAAFTLIAQMLSTMILPPRLTAELYRALADIPGIVARKNVRDITGRLGAAFLIPQKIMGVNEEIILNARTYQFLGEATWQDAPDVWVKHQEAWSGPDLFSEDAILAESLVAGPGKLP